MQTPNQTATGHLLLAKQLFFNGQYDLAASEVDKAIQLNPEFSMAHFVKGLLAIKLVDFTSARESLHTAISLQEDFAQAWAVLAYLDRELGNLEEALCHVERAIQVDPKKFLSHMQRGAILAQVGRLAEAADAYRQATLMNPSSMVAHFKLGSILLKLGKNDAAERAIVRAYQLDPANANSRLALGDLFVSRGDYERAIEEYQAAIDLSGRTTPVPHYKLGEACFQAGLHREAILSLKIAIRRDPKHVQSYLLLGRIHLLRDEPQASVELLEAVVQIDDSYPEAQRLLQEARAAAGVDAESDPPPPKKVPGSERDV